MLRRSIRCVPLVLALPVLLGGCDDPSCAFAPGNCQEIPDSNRGGGGGGVVPSDPGDPTALPTVGNWIDPGPPEFVRMVPDGDVTTSTGAVWVYFSESIDPTSTEGAFEFIDLFFGFPAPALPESPVVGDGTILTVVPAFPLSPGSSFVLRLTEGHTLRDLTGQPVAAGPLDLGTVSIGFDGDDQPKVLATYPQDGDLAAGDLAEICVLFDRAMDLTTVVADQWEVGIDGNLVTSTPPEVLVANATPVDVPVPSVFSWRNQDALGNRVSYGPDVFVETRLSSSSEILDADGNPLAPFLFEFRTQDLLAPVEISKPSAPFDAFGVAQLSGPDLALEVDMSPGVLTDELLTLYTFGIAPGGETVISFLQEVPLVADQAQVLFTADELGLSDGVTPLFGDGDLVIAGALHRNTLRSQLRVIDGDPGVRGLQTPFLDTVPPVLLGLGQDGAQAITYRSDLPDLTVVGLASEEIGFCRVSVDGGGPANFAGMDIPPVVAADADGLFVASPVALGTIDPFLPPNFTVEVFDRAGNPALAPIGSQLRQLGGLGFWDPMPFDLQVEVYDETTLAPIPGAFVMVQQDDVGHTMVGSGTTDGNGLYGLNFAFGAVPIVTVDAPGYDLFTVQVGGYRTASIGLRPTNLVSGFVGGGVTAQAPLDLNQFKRTVADGRGTFTAELHGTQGCEPIPNSILSNCAFGPYPVRPDRIGATTLFVENLAGVNQTILVPNALGAFAAGFLQAFVLRAPAPGVAAGESDLGVTLDVPTIFALLDPDQQPVSTEPLVFTSGTLVNFGNPLGLPTVNMEGVSPGSPDPWIVGSGAAIVDPGLTPETWVVRGVWPGVVDDQADGPMGEMGQLVQNGAVEPDLFLRLTVRDDQGGIAMARAPKSVAALLPAIAPADLPIVTSPAPLAAVGPSFDATLEDVLPADVFGVPTAGLYETTLIDEAGRRWTLWSANPAGTGGAVEVHVPDVAGMGGTPLTAGAVTMFGTVFADPGLDPTEFQWSEIARRAWARSQSPAISFTFNP